ncbi:anthranilate synthase component II [Alteromonas sp. a30]|uniref:anthranilate synthase component II n=1 Tax=Alteromonas sp. a30 TaxID=2730917 RepID=UPI0022829F06|nr:aminodeoxychorismate/anthranilate synthase component II [Alteromonas sp. a30]MCY7295161.1 aminodeoxychorismate/anthranilate synthase component II [Alteromonas sp. a30]
MAQAHIILIDNIDSFTYNLVDELRVLGHKLTVFRNNVSVEKVMSFMRDQGPNTLLMLSPGPGNPSSAGNMLTLIEQAAGEFPVLGICLGHQAIVQHYGGIIDRAPQAMHGKSSPLTHCENRMFAGLEQGFTIARYHSLMAATIPDSLSVLAHSDHIPMCVYHQAQRMLGFQFHPESILTAQGSQLLRQSIDYLIQSGEPNAC